MPAVIVRNLSSETHRALKARARTHGRSTEAEIRAILEAATRPEGATGIGSALSDLGRVYGGVDIEVERERTPSEPIDFA